MNAEVGRAVENLKRKKIMKSGLKD